MKKNIIVLLLMVCSSSVLADNLFQSNNPFPQTAPQSLNNIYESEPATIQKEIKQEKKSWFKRKSSKKSSDYVIPESKIINEGTNDGSFYVFK